MKRDSCYCSAAKNKIMNTDRKPRVIFRQALLEKYNSKKEEDEQLDEDIITELTKEHTGNDLYISHDTVLQQIEDLQFGTERTKTLKNCFGIEIFLRSEKDQLFTFVHSSIYEYFFAKWICDAFRNLLEKWLHHDINIDA